MNTPLRVGVAGAGNVGTHLARRLAELGDRVILTGVWSRRPERVRPFLDASVPVTDQPEALMPADIILLAVPDRVIGQVSEIFRPYEVLTAHTSGATPKEALRTERKGLFYPLQSFRKEKPEMNWEDIPVFIDAVRPSDLELLRRLALLTGGEVIPVTPEMQPGLHAAAVYANNFTNALLAASRRIMETQGWDFRLLLPLIRETVARLEEFPPEAVQTGPAVRGDEPTVQTHLSWLKDRNLHDEAALYEAVTRYIIRRLKK
ncbi:MAG: DUF2520 domain-containing protein [Chlorobi bacterium]|nr:DUF2520 domain-containing protein [Chlorobiota bacterium]